MLFKDKEAFKLVFDEYYNPLCNFIYNILNDKSSVEDVVQEMFVKMWQSNESIDISESMKSYLFKSAKNKALEHIRASNSYNKAVKDSLLLRFSEEEPSEKAEVYIKMERISSLLRHLPSKCRNVFVMHKFNGLTYREIADKESISIKTVENHMLKAFKYLRENFKVN